MTRIIPLCLLLFSFHISANDNPELINLIKETKHSLIEEAYELVQQKIHEASERQAPEWDEQEGEEGNMVYDKAVVQEDNANEFVYRYLEFTHGDDSTIENLRDDIVKITVFIAEMKKSILADQQAHAACLAKKEKSEELIAENEHNSALLNLYYLLRSQDL